MFQFGFKGKPGDASQNLRHQIYNEVLLDMIAGEASPLYRRLYDSGLINATFESEVMAGRDYLCSVFMGESHDPDKVAAELKAEVERLRREGLDPEAFGIAKRAAYGRYIGMFSKVEAVAGLMMLSHFYGIEMYQLPELVANLTLEDLALRLEEDFETDKSALSVVNPV